MEGKTAYNRSLWSGSSRTLHIAEVLVHRASLYVIVLIYVCTNYMLCHLRLFSSIKMSWFFDISFLCCATNIVMSEKSLFYLCAIKYSLYFSSLSYFFLVRLKRMLLIYFITHFFFNFLHNKSVTTQKLA